MQIVQKKQQNSLCGWYERPGDESTLTVRQNSAREYYNRFKGKSAPLRIASVNGSILECAERIHSYMEQMSYSYCVSMIENQAASDCDNTHTVHGLNSTFEESVNNYHNTCCATYVSWVLQAAGYINECQHGASRICRYA